MSINSAVWEVLQLPQSPRIQAQEQLFYEVLLNSELLLMQYMYVFVSCV